MIIDLKMKFQPSTFGRKSKDNIERIQEAFRSFSKLETKVKEIWFEESDNFLKATLLINNLNEWRKIQSGKYYKTLFSTCFLFLGKNGFEIIELEEASSTSIKNRNKHNATKNIGECKVCKLNYSEYDIRKHNVYHFKHVIFCLEHNYDFGISKANLRDTAKWKLEDVIKNKKDLSMNMKVTLSLDLLKGEYIYNGKNFIENISFEDYTKNELKENTRKHNETFSELGVLEVLHEIF